MMRAFHPLPMWPGFESRRRRRHRMCVEFVVSARLCPKRVFPQAWFSHPLKHLFQILIRSELIWKMSPIRRSHVYQFLLSTVVCPVWYDNVSLIPPPWTTYNAQCFSNNPKLLLGGEFTGLLQRARITALIKGIKINFCETWRGIKCISKEFLVTEFCTL